MTDPTLFWLNYVRPANSPCNHATWGHVHHLAFAFYHSVNKRWKEKGSCVRIVFHLKIFLPKTPDIPEYFKQKLILIALDHFLPQWQKDSHGFISDLEEKEEKRKKKRERKKTVTKKPFLHLFLLLLLVLSPFFFFHLSVFSVFFY